MKNILNHWKYGAIAICGLCMGLGGGYLMSLQMAPQDAAVISQEPAIAVAPTVEELFPYVIPPNSTLNSVLREFDVTPQVIHQIVEGAKPVFNLGRLNPGTRFQLVYLPGNEDELIEVKFRFSPVEMLDVKKMGDAWVAEKITEMVDTKVMTFSGTVSTSLWESAVQAKMDPNLISDLAEVFAWQVDFSREVRMNDRWRIAVEQKLVKGKPIGWGSIIAAEYENAGQKFSGVLFKVNDQERGYYALDGTSLRRMFLKSPIRYGRISSRFTMKRFHPVLQFNRPHLGVDYAAPVGTPIRAVGDGVIELAGNRGGAGNMIKLRHNGTYSTAYKHLSGFARGVRTGSRVQQGQIIGYVGNTGLSTGPHLHFEFFQGGKYVDPLGRKFPSSEPIPAQLMTQFQSEAAMHIAALPAWKGEQIGKTSSLPPQEPEQ